MSNGIKERQNTEANLQKLIAIEIIYAKAKVLIGIQAILSIPIVILLTLIPIVVSSDKLLSIGISNYNYSLLLATYGLLTTLLNTVIINPCAIRFKEKGAKLQESFDCSVLVLSWNDIKDDIEPDAEETRRYTRKYLNDREKITEKKDWYTPGVDALPLPVARIACQRINCWWDADLRVKFRNLIIVVSIITFILLFIFALIQGMTIPRFITDVLTPFLPALIFAIREVQDNNKAINSLNDLKKKEESIWNEILRNDEYINDLEDVSRRIQDEIYNNRKSNPLVFDWYYNMHRNDQEDSTRYSIKQAIVQYTNR